MRLPITTRNAVCRLAVALGVFLGSATVFESSVVHADYGVTIVMSKTSVCPSGGSPTGSGGTITPGGTWTWVNGSTISTTAGGNSKVYQRFQIAMRVFCKTQWFGAGYWSTVIRDRYFGGGVYKTYV